MTIGEMMTRLRTFGRVTGLYMEENGLARSSLYTTGIKRDLALP